MASQSTGNLKVKLHMHFEFEEFWKFLLCAWVCFICVVLQLHEFRFVEYHT